MKKNNTTIINFSYERLNYGALLTAYAISKVLEKIFNLNPLLPDNISPFFKVTGWKFIRGWYPIMEAQYSGTPLICSDILVFREVAGNGAEFCNIDTKSIAKKIEFLINNSQKRLELISHWQENIKRFSKEKFVKQLEECLK